MYGRRPPQVSDFLPSDIVPIPIAQAMHKKWFILKILKENLNFNHQKDERLSEQA